LSSSSRQLPVLRAEFGRHCTIVESSTGSTPEMLHWVEHTGGWHLQAQIRTHRTAQLYRQLPIDHQEQLIGVLVGVPHELALDRDQLD
jgi:hypothetical protein